MMRDLHLPNPLAFDAVDALRLFYSFSILGAAQTPSLASPRVGTGGRTLLISWQHAEDTARAGNGGDVICVHQGQRLRLTVWGS